MHEIYARTQSQDFTLSENLGVLGYLDWQHYQHNVGVSSETTKLKKCNEMQITFLAAIDSQLFIDLLAAKTFQVKILTMITFSKVMNSASFSDDMGVNCEQGLIQYIKVMFKVQINSEY